MKKTFFFFLLLAMIASYTPAKAFLVTIPDANFRARLQTLYPACFVGAQMETSCTAITSATVLNVNALNIANLSGVEYFTSLQQLRCIQNQLTSLPTLPASLTLLRCETNQLTSLPALPASLTQLTCNNNQLTSLPTLPAGLMLLLCNNNQLTSLPTLPAGLTSLLCYANQLTSLPVLPASLQRLDCFSNPLTVLPALPAGLTALYCYTNQLTSLPTLPASLQILSCYNNPLTSLPTLPAGLTALYCYTNQLTSLPTLPASLLELVCDGNQLTILPALPASLQFLYCTRNQLTSLPLLPSGLKELVFDENLVTSFPNNTLPGGLTDLSFSRGKITLLPTLPTTLTSLYCDANELTSIPSLPTGLVFIACENNFFDFTDLEGLNRKPTNYTANPQSYKILPASQSLTVGGALSINGAIGGSLNVYKWFKNNVLISGATSAVFAIPSVAATDAGTYKCEVTSTFVGLGTTTGVTITSSNVVITVCPASDIAPNINALPDGNVGVPYSGITFTVSNAPVGAIYTFTQVSGVSLTTLGLSLNTVTGTISGTPNSLSAINIVIEATNNATGCASAPKSYTLAIRPNPATSIDNTLDNQVKVSPNPSSNDFNVDFGNLNMAKSLVRVYDAQGKVVFTFENNVNLRVISLEKFANGIYLMEVETSKGRILKRLAKQ